MPEDLLRTEIADFMTDPEGSLPERLVPSVKDNPLFRAAVRKKLRLDDDIVTEEDEENLASELLHFQGEMEQDTLLRIQSPLLE
ncbi:hypothetical protein MMC18_000326 [Xylographa bjoerkii]|nr:hypothetical protein [Xylographa bjoerkii]